MSSNPPVVLVHGFTSSFDRGWRQTGWVDLLADEGRAVVGVDLLGHGEAPKPHDPSAYADMGARVVDVLPECCDAVGFSLGAVVLLDVASRHPERFRRLALMGIGANLFRPRDAEDPLRPAFERFATGGGNDPTALAAFRQRPRSAVIDFAAVTCPVLVVLGERDPNGPADPLVEALGSDAVTVKVVRGVDHLGTPTDFGASTPCSHSLLDSWPADSTSRSASREEWLRTTVAPAWPSTLR